MGAYFHSCCDWRSLDRIPGPIMGVATTDDTAKVLAGNLASFGVGFIIATILTCVPREVCFPGAERSRGNPIVAVEHRP